MYHIAICDDEPGFLEELTAQLRRYERETGVELKLSAYRDGLALVERYDATVDLIFLDIRMQLLDGLETAARIRRRDARVGIIFLTTMAQYGLEGYRYHAESYILKPLHYLRLKTELDRFFAGRQGEAAPYLVAANDAGRFRLLLKDIRYLETSGRGVVYRTGQEAIPCAKRMKEAERELAGQGFARCHTSYLVNLFYVKGVKKLELTLVSGEVLPISQPRRKAFMAQLTDYWGDRL